MVTGRLIGLLCNLPSRMSTMPQETILSSQVADICTLQMPTALTVAEAIDVEKTVKHLANDGAQLSQLILDFSQTQFIDSSGIGALVISRRLSQQQGWALVLKNIQTQVSMALEMTDLLGIFTIESDEASEAPVAEPAAAANSEPERFSTHPSVDSLGKRVVDILGSLVGLGITAILFFPIAIAIQIDNPGPVFFRQVRCSWMGKRFTIWKFRTMVTNAEALKKQVKNELDGPLFKSKNDPRITRVGRFLRRTSLDELPQFWNVLKGDMSLVGTRPPTPDEIEQYQVPEWQRLNVKPGMTGEWQVSGRSTIKTFEEVIAMDLLYQQKWSLAYDIQLIVKTVLVLFSKRSGAL